MSQIYYAKCLVCNCYAERIYITYYYYQVFFEKRNCFIGYLKLNFIVNYTYLFKM